MAIKLIKLITKETLIGEIETDTIDFTEEIVIHDPMIVDVFSDDNDDTSLRLRSALSLSLEDFLIFQPKHVLTFYSPPVILEQYYNKIRSFIRADKEYVTEMIEEAIKEVEEPPIFISSDDKHLH